MMPERFSRSETRGQNEFGGPKFVFSRVSTNSAAGIKRSAAYDARTLFEVRNARKNEFRTAKFVFSRAEYDARTLFEVRNARKNKFCGPKFVFSRVSTNSAAGIKRSAEYLGLPTM